MKTLVGDDDANKMLPNSQYSENGSRVKELFLVLLDSDVVGAVVHVDVTVLSTQPHGGLDQKEYIFFSQVYLSVRS
jgi:hypothetical protein